MTVTGAIGAACMYPLRLIIRVCVRLQVHPNLLTLLGVLTNIVAAWLLGLGRFTTAGFVMLLANLFDFIDGIVARELRWTSRFGAFWDSVMDRFSDISLFIGLIYLYATRDSPGYVVITALAMMFSVMTSYTRARAESLIDKCKVGFLERPERIVLFMIGAFTNRMAAVLWVTLVLSIVTVADRIYYTWLVLNRAPQEAPQSVRPNPAPVPRAVEENPRAAEHPSPLHAAFANPLDRNKQRRW
jgi:CDP-diacylglycerol--glycerol-3-phosphate 3-phosphatidyltransferase